MLLPDINVWVALNFDSHVHHPAAKAWFDGLTDEVCQFCRFSQQGFLRLTTNPNAFGLHALAMKEAWQKFDLFLGDPRVSYAIEPPDLESHWRTLTQRQSYSHQLWGDAYLAAFALAGDLQLVTFDQGFSRFKGLNCLILK